MVVDKMYDAQKIYLFLVYNYKLNNGKKKKILVLENGLNYWAK